MYVNIKILCLFVIIKRYFGIQNIVDVVGNEITSDEKLRLLFNDNAHIFPQTQQCYNPVANCYNPTAISNLLFKKSRYTTCLRNPPNLQLNCMNELSQSNDLCSKYSKYITSINCANTGSDFYGNVIWRCYSKLPTGLIFNSTIVLCEGCDSPSDNYKILGSCGIYYGLIIKNMTMNPTLTPSIIPTLIPTVKSNSNFFHSLNVMKLKLKLKLIAIILSITICLIIILLYRVFCLNKINEYSKINTIEEINTNNEINTNKEININAYTDINMGDVKPTNLLHNEAVPLIQKINSTPSSPYVVSPNLIKTNVPLNIFNLYDNSYQKLIPTQNTSNDSLSFSISLSSDDDISSSSS